MRFSVVPFLHPCCTRNNRFSQITIWRYLCAIKFWCATHIVVNIIALFFAAEVFEIWKVWLFELFETEAAYHRCEVYRCGSSDLVPPEDTSNRVATRYYAHSWARKWSVGTKGSRECHRCGTFFKSDFMSAQDTWKPPSTILFDSRAWTRNPVSYLISKLIIFQIGNVWYCALAHFSLQSLTCWLYLAIRRSTVCPNLLARS